MSSTSVCTDDWPIDKQSEWQPYFGWYHTIRFTQSGIKGKEGESWGTFKSPSSLERVHLLLQLPVNLSLPVQIHTRHLSGSFQEKVSDWWCILFSIIQLHELGSYQILGLCRAQKAAIENSIYMIYIILDWFCPLREV